MADRNYWVDRFTKLEESQQNKGIEYYHELEKQYTRAAREIEKDIATWYSRFAVNNRMTMEEARKILTNNELKELRWSVEEYIEHGRENNINGRWMKELENASARVHISRLEALKLQMQQHCEVLFGNEADSFDKVMRNVYTEGYYRTAFELQKGVGVGYDLMKLDKNKIDKVISKPWAADGSNFSSRIWKQRSQMVSELHNQLTQMVIRGQTPDAAINAIKERFRVSKGQAVRLVVTETAFFHSAAQKDSFNDLGVAKYEICAVLDHKTSDICQDFDGRVFDMKDYQPGVTASPFHVHCRSTQVPYFNDEFTEGEVRAATNENGKTYFIPATTKYPEWKKVFVDGGSKGAFERVRESAQKMKPTNKNGEEIQFDWKGKDEKHAQQQQILSKLSNDYETRLQKVTVGAKGGAGDVDISGATMRVSDAYEYTAIHEFFHTLSNTDADKYGLTKDQDFWKEIRKIRTTYMKDVGNDTKRWISSYEHSNKSLDEFVAEAFTQSKMVELGLELPSKYGSDLTYSKQVLGVVDKYFRKTPLENIGKSSTIESGYKKMLDKREVVKNSDLKNGLSISGTPNSISDKTDDAGKVLQRRVYGDDGKAVVDYDTTDHGLPHLHPTGAHKNVFDHNKKNPHGKPQALSEQELINNEDIIKRGENYHDN